jgi:hypothetical protein
MIWRSAPTSPTACSRSRRSRAEAAAALALAALSALIRPAAAPAQALASGGYAKIAGEVDYTDDPAAPRDSDLLGSAELYGRHSLPFDGGSLVVRHDLRVEPTYGDAVVDGVTYSLYEAFVRLERQVGKDAALDLAAGRVFLPWGAGLSFHPADALNPVSQGTSGAFRPEEQGFDGVAITLSSTATAQAALSVDRALSQDPDWWRGLRSAARASTILGTFVGGVSAVYQPDETTRVGAHASVEVAGTVAAAEAAVDLEDGPALAATAHLLRVFSAGDITATVALEWYQQDSRRFAAGFPNAAVIAPALALAKGDAVSLENTLFVSLDDGSVLARHALSWGLGPQDELRLIGSWTAGARDTAFGGLPLRATGEISLLVHF